MLIYKPFNAVFFGCLAIFMIFLIVTSIKFRKKTLKFRRKFLAGIMIATLVVFVLYKLFLSKDTEFVAICQANGISTFNWWRELCFQMCNINMILIPIGALTMKKPLLNFSFFTGTLGAFMALVMPAVGFYDCSILLPRMLGYYITHFMVFTGALAIVTYGIHTPKMKELPKTALLVVGVTFCVFLINVLFRTIAPGCGANYFYTMDPEGNAILEALYNLIPIPFVYELPLILVLVVFMVLVTFILNLFRKKKKA